MNPTNICSDTTRAAIPPSHTLAAIAAWAITLGVAVVLKRIFQLDWSGPLPALVLGAAPLSGALVLRLLRSADWSLVIAAFVYGAILFISSVLVKHWAREIGNMSGGMGWLILFFGSYWTSGRSIIAGAVVLALGTLLAALLL